MDLALGKEKWPLAVAVLTLVLLGLSLSYLTLQNLRAQKSAMERHMVLAARSVAGAVEGTLRRGMGMRMGRGMGMGGANGSGVFRPYARELFSDLEQRGDVLFVGIVGSKREWIITAAEGPDRAVALPESAYEALSSQGTWFGELPLGGRTALVYAKRAGAGLADWCMPAPEAEGPRPPCAYLVVGLDMTEHYKNYRAFAAGVLLQTGLVMGLALFVWILGFALVRRRAQAGQAAMLRRFQSALLDNMPDGLVTLDPGGTVVSANSAAARILSEGEPLVGRKWTDLPLAEDEQAKTHGQAHGQWTQHQYRGRRLELLSVDYTAEQGQARKLVLIRDRTRQKALEDELGEAERLAAVGRMAAGAAHEIRNPLSALRGFAQYFAGKLAGDDPGQAYAETMVREADRLNKVVTDMLYLARPAKPEKQLIGLAPLVDEAVSLSVAGQGTENIQIVRDIGEPEVCADPDALKQALINLILNALDAVEPETGRIVVGSGRTPDGVEVWVVDNGPGMDEAAREHAFEPFFTTKGKGAGLGLAMVHSLVREHGGRVCMDTGPGGTRITMLFPHAGDVQTRTEGQ